MNRGGIGAASIMLVFVVLCLTIFAVISLVPALTDATLVNAEVQLVQAFFEADATAEEILAEILAAWDMARFMDLVEFAVPINDDQALHVVVGLDFDFYEIIEWRMVNLAEWEADDRINIWDGYWYEGW